MRRGLGEFQPLNALGGRRDRPAANRQDNPGGFATLSQPPQKRRRVDEVPSTSSPLSHASSPKPATAGSPDRSLRQGSASSVLPGDGPEPQIVVPSALRRRGRRRRVVYGITTRPDRLTSPSIADSPSDHPHHHDGRATAEIVHDSDEDVDADDHSPVEEVKRPKATPPQQRLTQQKTQQSRQHNTELSIVLDAGLPKRQTFRSRMQSGDQGSRGSFLSLLQTHGPLKRPVSDSRRFSESADELSEDHYSERPARKAMRGPSAISLEALSSRLPQPARRPTNGLSSGPVPMSVGTIIEAPVRVTAAFRHPSHVFQSGSTAGQSPPLTMTIDPRDPGTLTLAAPALRKTLPWLQIPLDKARIIQYNTDSPFLCLDFPQSQNYHATMGVHFASEADARRVVTWILESPLLRNIRVENKLASFLDKRFERCLASAKEQKEKIETRAKIEATFDDSVDAELEIKSAGRAANSSPACKPGSGPSTPHTTEGALSGVYKDGLASLRRTRRSLQLGPAAELVSLDSIKRTPGSPRTPDTPEISEALGASADSRLSRLRNRNSRASLRYLEDPEAERWTEQNPGWSAGWRIPLTYSRTTVDKDDVARLDEGEFLNDNIINFYLQFLQGTLKKSESSIAKRVYFHNTFFYEKLRPSKGSIISFEGVKRWTAKVDLFSYDYIVVPVNENAHWWVAIICNVPKILEAAVPPTEEPGKKTEAEGESRNGEGDKPKPESIDVDAVRKPASIPVDDDNEGDNDVEFVSASATPSKGASASPLHAGGNHQGTPINVEESELLPKIKTKAPILISSVEVDDAGKTAKPQSSTHSSTHGSTSPGATDKDRPDGAPDGGDAFKDSGGDDDEVTEIQRNAIPSDPLLSAATSAKKPFRGGGRSSKKVFIPGGKKQDPKDPRIFTLDSLGSVHTASVDHLKQWLMAEIAERKGVKPLDPGRLGTTAKAIPEQENFCDCGLFLLLYIQEFIKDPDSFIEDIVLRRERKWDTSAPDMRKQLRDLILHMQREYQDAEETARRLKKKQQLKRASAPVTAPPVLAQASAMAADDDVALPPAKKGTKEDTETAEMMEICDTSSLVRSSSPIAETDQPMREAAGRGRPVAVQSDIGLPSSESDAKKDDGEAKVSESGESAISPAEAGCSSPFKDASPTFARPT